MTLPASKLSQLRAAWDSGDKLNALRIAARFQSLGAEKEAFVKGDWRKAAAACETEATP